MGKVLEFKRKPDTVRVDTTQPEQANEPVIEQVDRFSPEDIAKGIRSLFTKAEMEQIQRELEDELGGSGDESR